MSVLQVTFFLISLLLSFLFFLYGFNLYYLLNAGRRYKLPDLAGIQAELPSVSIQLPIYNEKYVVRRLVVACARMAEVYGKDRARLLLLDDSDDDTLQEVDAVVAEFAAQGFQIEILRRAHRQGFKAGALQAALERTPEDFIAIFDADFRPPADFLNRILPYFVQDESLGIVQGRWRHLNRDYNLITQAAAIAIDIHFIIEQPGRYAEGLFQNFNGSGGVLRKKAILESGGWQSDTLAEDLDLSYRMQLQGFRVLYLKDLEIPAEIPPTIPSFKQQQGRWAFGSLQTAKKILPGLLRQPEIEVKKRLQAFIHMTGYLLNPLMTISFVLASLATVLNLNSGDASQANFPALSGNLLLSAAALVEYSLARMTWPLLLLLIVLCTIAPWVSSVMTLRFEKRPVSQNLAGLLVLLLLGFGISLNNTLEAGKALFTKQTGEFTRTPKYADLQGKAAWRDSSYQVAFKPVSFLELAFAFVGVFASVNAFLRGNYFVLLILIPFTVSYFFISVMAFLQARPGKI